MELSSSYIKSCARDAMRDHTGSAIIAYVVLFGVTLLVNNIVPLLGILVLWPMSYSYEIWFLKYCRDNENIDAGNLFDGLSKEYGRALLAYFLRYVFIFLWSLLLIVPGIIKSYSYSMMFYIMNDSPDMEPMDAMEESMRIMDGHKMELFMLDLSFIGWILLIICTFGIAALWVVPYMCTSRAEFYRELTQDGRDYRSSNGEDQQNQDYNNQNRGLYNQNQFGQPQNQDNWQSFDNSNNYNQSAPVNHQPVGNKLDKANYINNNNQQMSNKLNKANYVANNNQMNNGYPNNNQYGNQMNNGGYPNHNQPGNQMNNGGYPNNNQYGNQMNNGGYPNHNQPGNPMNNGGYPNHNQPGNPMNNGGSNHNQPGNPMNNGGYPNHNQPGNPMNNGGYPNNNQYGNPMNNGGYPNHNQPGNNNQMSSDDALMASINNEIDQFLGIESAPQNNPNNVPPGNQVHSSHSLIGSSSSDQLFGSRVDPNSQRPNTWS